MKGIEEKGRVMVDLSMIQVVAVTRYQTTGLSHPMTVGLGRAGTCRVITQHRVR